MRTRPPRITIHAERVEMLRLSAINPYAKNARKHPEGQIKALAATIRQSGFTAPLIIDDENTLISGHGRALAAKALGMALVPCVRAKGLSDAQVRALRLADNQLALGSEWDLDLLRAELGDVHGLGFDLGDLGFSGLELGQIGVAGFLPAEQIARAEETPEPPKKPVSRLGDLWLLGDHRLLCGDSTSAEDVARLLGEDKPYLMVTDPPYGVDYDADWRNRADRANGKPYGARAIGLVQNDERVDWREAWANFPGDVAYCWHAGRHASTVQASLEAETFQIRSQVIWAKDRLIISRGDYHWQHEPCWYAVRKGKRGHWSGDRSQTTLWQIGHLKSETGHSTQKPIECMRRPILNNSKTGDAVYDPFLGSGTTLIAAEMEARKCFGLEIDPAYIDVIVQRFMTFTNNQKKAILVEPDRTERTFEEVRTLRSAKVKRSVLSSRARKQSERQMSDVSRD